MTIARPSAIVKRQRLFAVDVLAGLNRVDGRQGVPVIGRADHDRIHVLIVEQPTIIRILGASVADAGLGLAKAIAIDVAHGNDIPKVLPMMARPSGRSR